jgi:hypothetical protein
MGFFEGITGRSGTEKIVAQTRVLMERGNFINRHEEQRNLINLVLESGEEGIVAFIQCFSDAFAMRAHPFFSVWHCALEIAQKTNNERLFELIALVVRDGGDLVTGPFQPPSWFPAMETDIAGGGRFGWGDDTWIPVAHEGAEFLRDNIGRLPLDKQPAHLQDLKSICQYRADRWNAVKSQGPADPEFVEKEITYWEEFPATVAAQTPPFIKPVIGADSAQRSPATRPVMSMSTSQQSVKPKPAFPSRVLVGIAILVIIALLVIVPTKTIMVKNEVSYQDNETYTEQVPYEVREAYRVNESYIDLYDMDPVNKSYFDLYDMDQVNSGIFYTANRFGKPAASCPSQCPCSAFSDIDYMNPPYERYCIECVCQDSSIFSSFLGMDDKYKNAVQTRSKTKYHNVTKMNNIEKSRTVTKTRIDQQPAEVNWIFGFNTSYALHLPGVG